MNWAQRYFDAAATAPLVPQARAAMIDALDAGPGNASSVHSAGYRARVLVDDARAAVGAALGARNDEVVFTAGGTEANNLAVTGFAQANPRGRHIVTTPIEHPSIIESCRYLERLHGYEITMLPVDSTGLVSIDDVAAALRESTTLVTIGLGNGEVGTVQPIAQIGELVRSHGVLMHTDAVQAASSLPVSFDEGGWPGTAVDAMTVASHKFGGPQGAGALLVRRGIPCEPLLHGGGQEGGLRSGTENVPALAGFAAAVTAARDRVGTRASALAASRDRLIDLVLAEVPGASLTGHPTERLPGHASFTIAGVSGESVLVALDAAGFSASSGSACAAGKDEPSPVLLAMGVRRELAQTAVRFTFTTAPDPETEGELFARVVGVMRSQTRR